MSFFTQLFAIAFPTPTTANDTPTLRLLRTLLFLQIPEFLNTLLLLLILALFVIIFYHVYPALPSFRSYHNKIAQLRLRITNMTCELNWTHDMLRINDDTTRLLYTRLTDALDDLQVERLLSDQLQACLDTLETNQDDTYQALTEARVQVATLEQEKTDLNAEVRRINSLLDRFRDDPDLRGYPPTLPPPLPSRSPSVDPNNIPHLWHDLPASGLTTLF